MGTAIKHPVPDRFKPSFVIFNIQALCLMLKAERQSARMSKITDDCLTWSYSSTHMATVGIKGLNEHWQ